MSLDPTSSSKCFCPGLRTERNAQPSQPSAPAWAVCRLSAVARQDKHSLFKPPFSQLLVLADCAFERLPTQPIGWPGWDAELGSARECNAHLLLVQHLPSPLFTRHASFEAAMLPCHGTLQAPPFHPTPCTALLFRLIHCRPYNVCTLPARSVLFSFAPFSFH